MNKPVENKNFSETAPCTRNIDEALREASKMVNLIKTPEADVSDSERQWVAESTYQNFANHINKGFLEYRKSVTETSDFALTDWQGEGSILRDVLGREYIDMLGGFGLYSPGIRHPKIVAAAKAQLDRSPQYSQEMLDPLRAHLAKVIAKLTPGDIQYGFFANSGTEAVDGAMKLAKLYTGKSGFISTLKGFHGKSLGALSLLGKAVYRQPLLPLLNNVHQVPYGDADAIEEALRCAKEVGNDIAGVVVEPIQGEAGAIEPPDDYWPRLREICDKYEVLLIADEVQTGFGRTGKIFGVDHWNVTPDIMCFGKALGGGVIAMSGFFSTAKIWKCMEPNPFMHTTTTGGNPVACAAALAAVTVLVEEDLAGQAAEKGEYIKKKVNELQQRYPQILNGIRGRGLLLGMEFPTDEIGYKVASGLFSRGVLTAGTLTNAQTIRIEPALTISYELIDEMLKRLEDTFISLG
ncbi:putrescine aminotransferase [Desulforhopalus singaporensis]|uniref:Taurine--pyruvate aminotransferase n=1 Tax=Desulforhopalus singaporensis TaxID=91360 RepID=A0A1H0LVR5_9BACT|nr:putrescine aminotransferase [Desulforhopalus singaporensis]SDO72329.1 putrescine aminotransferase [Desulforhopalus singaporensis]